MKTLAAHRPWELKCRWLFILDSTFIHLLLINWWRADGEQVLSPYLFIHSPFTFSVSFQTRIRIPLWLKWFEWNSESSITNFVRLASADDENQCRNFMSILVGFFFEATTLRKEFVWKRWLVKTSDLLVHNGTWFPSVLDETGRHSSHFYVEWVSPPQTRLDPPFLVVKINGTDLYHLTFLIHCRVRLKSFV